MKLSEKIFPMSFYDPHCIFGAMQKLSNMLGGGAHGFDTFWYVDPDGWRGGSHDHNEVLA